MYSGPVFLTHSVEDYMGTDIIGLSSTTDYMI